MQKQSSSPREIRPQARYLEIDFFRGIAIAMMLLFHGLFDLSLFKLAELPLFSNPFWLVYRETAVFIFLSVSGFCLYLEHREQIRWKRFWLRFFKLSLAGALITVATHSYDPSRTIWLGILQFFALASLLGLFFLRFDRLNLIIGVLIIALGFIGNVNEAPHFISPGLTWLGFGTMRLATFEIFSLIPFFGYFLIGIYLGRYFLKQKNEDYFLLKLNGQHLSVRGISFMGKYSLLIYLLHQPIFLGLLSLLAQTPP